MKNKKRDKIEKNLNHACISMAVEQLKLVFAGVQLKDLFSVPWKHLTAFLPKNNVWVIKFLSTVTDFRSSSWDNNRSEKC